MDDPFSHPLWPAFADLINAAPGWSFIGEHRDNQILSLWHIFRAGAEAENKRMLEET